MYTAAGYLVGQLAGVPWEQWVQERIFEPLLMANSNFSIEETARHTNAAAPYIDKDNQVQATAYRNLDVIGPAGSINSNVMEMANWVLLQLNQGHSRGSNWLRKEASPRCIRPRCLAIPRIFGKRSFLSALTA